MPDVFCLAQNRSDKVALIVFSGRPPMPIPSRTGKRFGDSAFVPG
jgi:hypothetical protein